MVDNLRNLRTLLAVLDLQGDERVLGPRSWWGAWAYPCSTDRHSERISHSCRDWQPLQPGESAGSSDGDHWPLDLLADCWVVCLGGQEPTSTQSVLAGPRSGRIIVCSMARFKCPFGQLRRMGWRVFGASRSARGLAGVARGDGVSKEWHHPLRRGHFQDQSVAAVQAQVDPATLMGRQRRSRTCQPSTTTSQSLNSPTYPSGLPGRLGRQPSADVLLGAVRGL